MLIEFVSATRLSQEDFWKQSALGQSLMRLGFDKRLTGSFAFQNTRGLPEIYNHFIAADSESDALVFVHDDVWIEDYYFADRVIDALGRFDVVGLAGNRRCPPEHSAWCFVDDAFTPDRRENLSGAVAHGKTPMGKLAHFGETPAACELLDGLMLIARKSRLRETAVRFDERFAFHFYDLDFCRTARSAGLALGTWPIAVTHQSNGAFGSSAWRATRARYREKWPTSAA